MKNIYLPLIRKHDIVVREVADETLVYDISRNRAFCLNPTSAAIWKLCDGTLSIEDIALRLGMETEKDVNDDLVWLAVSQFSKEGLLDRKPSNLDLNEYSRRSAVKRIAVTSTLALPIIASLVAPAAAQTASCLPPNDPCVIGTPPLCCEFCNGFGSQFPGFPGICSPPVT
ncbi:MAG: PqqD family protein [Pyrinomonadaceae bacterium]|nr:PqqD family protein [Pyrinomonadaceae bacterium]